MGHATLTTPLQRVICHLCAWTWRSLYTCVQNLTNLASAVTEIALVPSKI